MDVVGEVAGLTLPRTGSWEIDPNHTTAEFVVRHVLTKVRGRFTKLSGAIHVAEKPEDSTVEVEIEAASIETHTEDRDNHLRSPDFLDVARFPKLTFKSTALRPAGENTFQLDGDMTIKDVTLPVTLDVEFIGAHDSPWGTKLATFSARTDIDRHDFGMTWNMAIETGGWLVGRNVRIELEIEAVYKAE
ncbi:MAG: YceI family protein [Actinomycetota bacterium]